jgi:nucleotidyltransferase/DNA polymerase involved in DNA repair
MFACLYSLSTPLAALVALAESFTPRFEVKGPLVLLDVSGLSRLLGTIEEIGEELRRASPGPVRIAMAPTQTAAALLALSRAGLTIVAPGTQAAALAPLPVSALGDLDRLRLLPSNDAAADRHGAPVRAAAASDGAAAVRPPHVGQMWDALPYFESTLERTSELAARVHNGGWMHPRDAHAARHVRPRRPVSALRDTEHPFSLAPHERARADANRTERPVTTTAGAHAPAAASPRQAHEALSQAIDLLQTLRRWGIKTLGALAALPSGEVYERLGARGVAWQRLAQGEDRMPLVPWIPEDPFEASLALEWPIEGLEPLSFVLGRLFEPLAARLERADRGAAILHTHLRLVSRAVHARTIALPAPMRDPKTLRTLVLLDLEANPPSAAVDEVRVLVEPTPARVLQWTLYERAQPSPEQTSTLIARLTALMGDGHVGSPQLVDSWKPELFTMTPFAPHAQPPVDSREHTPDDVSHAAPGLRPAAPDAAPHAARGTLDTAPQGSRGTLDAAPHAAHGTPDAAPHGARGTLDAALP